MNTRLLKRGNFWRIFLALFIALALELCAGGPPWTVFADEDHIIQGNVGIGTASPGGKRLKAQGDAEVTGNLTVGGTFSPSTMGSFTMTGELNTTAAGTSGINLRDSQLLLRSSGDYNHKIWYYDGIAFATNRSHGNFRFYGEDSVSRNNAGGADLLLDMETQTGSQYFDWRGQFRINTAGNVGIGTTVPGKLLDVSGGEIRLINSGNSIARIASTGSGDAFLYFDAQDGDFSGGDYSWLGQGNNGLVYWRADAGAGSIQLQTGAGGVNNFTFTQAGNVGIGTTVPGAKLDIKDDGGLTISGSNYDDGVRIKRDLSTGLAHFIVRQGAPNSGVRFIFGGTERVVFEGSGNVGINTTAPEAKLDVAGPLRVNTAGDTGVAQDLVLTNIDASTIKSYSPLTVQSGGINDNYNLTLKGTGTGKVYVDDDLEVTGTTTFPSGLTVASGNITASTGNVSASSGSGTFATLTVSGATNLATTSGNVGIGTTDPGSSKLYVAGTTHDALNVYVDSDIWHTKIGGATGALRIGGQTNSGAVIQSFNPGTSAVRDLYLQRDGGNVSIGSNSPVSGAKLDIQGGGDLNLHKTGKITFNHPGQTGRQVLWIDDAGTYLRNWDNTSTDGIFLQLYDGTTLMKIENTGNVGIGTTGPLGKLDVRMSTAGTATVSYVTATTGSNYAIDADATGTGATLNVGGFFAATGGTTNYSIQIPSGYPVAGANNYAIYSASAAQSYFAGNVGIGTASPGSYKLYVNGPQYILNNLEVGGNVYANYIRAYSGGMQVDGNLSIGNYGSTGIFSRFAASNDGTSQIQFYDNNSTEGSYIKSVGATHGGDIFFGARWDDDEDKMVISNRQSSAGAAYDIKVGIGTTSPVTKLQVGSKVSDDNNFAFDANSAYFIHQTPTSTATLNDPKTVLLLARQGTGGQAYGAGATFNLSRYENNGTNSRTRLDISLAHNSFDITSNNIMTLLSNGNVGIGTASPTQRLEVSGTVKATAFQGDGSGLTGLGGWTDGGANVYLATATDYVGIGTSSPQRKLHITQGQDGGSNSIFEDASADRPGIALRGYYPEIDMISNAYTNTSHGSTLRLAAYDDSNRTTWKHWVIGTPGVGASWMDIGYAQNDANPHAGINGYAGASTSGKTIMRLKSDGAVGIGTTNPGAKLHIYGATGTQELLLQSGDSDARLFLKSGNTTGHSYMHFKASNDAGVELARQHSTGKFYINHNLLQSITGAAFVIQADGNVGIGTTSPASLFEVNGSGGKFSVFSDAHAVFNNYVNWGGSLGTITWDATALSAFNINAGTNRALSFGSNATSDRMVLASSGNVGIGSTAPAQKLDVYPDTDNSVRLGRAFVGYVGHGDYAAFSHLDQSSTTGYALLQYYNGEVFINRPTGANINFRENNSDQMIIKTGGYVGIGTTVPVAKLHILQTAAPTGIGSLPSNVNQIIDSNTHNYVLFRNSADNNTNAGLLFQDNNVGGYLVFRNAGASYSDSMLLGTYQDFYFQTGSSETVGGKTDVVTIKQNGNVGIGTTSPGAKLDVSGDIKVSGSVASEMNYDSINDGLILYYPFSENAGTAAKDRSKSGITATLTSTTWGDGKIGRAVSIDNTSGANIEVPANSVFNFGTGDWTFSTWVYPTALNTCDTVIAQTGPYYILRLGCGDATRWDIYHAGTQYVGPVHGMVTNKWYFITLERKSNVLYLYQNGVQTWSQDVTGQNTNMGNAIWKIGNSSWSPTSEMWSKYIDEFRVYNRALTADEINILYQRGLGAQSPYINSNGNVGIGTTNPGGQLDIYNPTLNNATFQGRLRIGVNNDAESSDGTFNEAAPSYGIEFTRDWQSGSQRTSQGGIYSWGSGGWTSGLAFRTYKSATGVTTKMVITGSGNVGIGTLAPSAPLNVYNSAGNNDGIPLVKFSKGGTPTGNIQYDTMILEANDVPTLRIKDSDGTTSTICSGDNYFTFASTHPIRFYTASNATGLGYSGMGGTLGMMIDNSGNLSVNGTTTLGDGTGDTVLMKGYYLNNDSGAFNIRSTATNGNLYLKSDGTGDVYINNDAGDDIYLGRSGSDTIVDANLTVNTGQLNLGSATWTDGDTANRRWIYPNDKNMALFIGDLAHADIPTGPKDVVGVTIYDGGAGRYFVVGGESDSAGGSITPLFWVESDGDAWHKGSVGIGTTGPGGKLEISSTMNAGATTGSILLTHPSNYQRSSIVFPSRVNWSSDYGFIEYRDDDNDSGEAAQLTIGTSNDGDDDVVIDPAGRLQILATNATLDTSGNLTVQGTAFLKGINVASYANGGRITECSGEYPDNYSSPYTPVYNTPALNRAWSSYWLIDGDITNPGDHTAIDANGEGGVTFFKVVFDKTYVIDRVRLAGRYDASTTDGQPQEFQLDFSDGSVQTFTFPSSYSGIQEYNIRPVATSFIRYTTRSKYTTGNNGLRELEAYTRYPAINGTLAEKRNIFYSNAKGTELNINVGIGTTGPQQLLHINGTDMRTRLQSGSVYTDLHQDGNGLRFHSNAVNNILSLNSGGSIGIGAASPTAKLEIHGSGSFTPPHAATLALGKRPDGATASLGIGIDATNYWHLDGATDLTFHTANPWTQRFTFSRGGNFTATGSITANGGFLGSITNSYGLLASSDKEHYLGESTNWDAVGFGNLTNLHFQGHSNFWVGAGNGTWFLGSGNVAAATGNKYTGSPATGGGSAHDLLLTTMYGGNTGYCRGITFAADGTGAGNSGWRLGKMYAGDSYNDGAKLFAIDSNVLIKGHYTDQADYYANSRTSYPYPGWLGTGMQESSLVVANAMMIQASNTGTSATNPVLYFHQYGYGGPKIQYDGPNNKLIISDADTSNRLDTVEIGSSATLSVSKLDIAAETRTGTHATGKMLYVTGGFADGQNLDGGIEFRHSNASQGIGFGYNTIYATGANADQNLNLKAKGTGQVGINSNAVASSAFTVNGDFTAQAVKIHATDAISRTASGPLYIGYQNTNTLYFGTGAGGTTMDFRGNALQGITSLAMTGGLTLGGPIAQTGNGGNTFSGNWTGLGAGYYNYFKINPQYSDGVGGTLVGLNVDMTSANLTITNKYAATFLGGSVGIGTTGPGQKLHVMGTDVGGTEPLQEAQRPTVEVEGTYPNIIIKSQGNASHSSTLGFWSFDGTNTQQWNMGVGQNGVFSMGYTTNNTNPHAGINDYAVTSALKIDTSNNATFANSLSLAGTINTGQGATEVYPMNQSVQTTDSPTFVDLNSLRYVYGDYGIMLQSTDEWLRLNQDGSHTSGVFTPSLLRADGGHGTANVTFIQDSGTSRNSSNAYIVTKYGWEANSGYMKLWGFAPNAMYRTLEDQPAPYGIGFTTGGESCGIMPVATATGSLGEMMNYMGNDGQSSFTWRRQTWEGGTYYGSGSHHYQTLLMKLDWNGALTLNSTVGIGGAGSGSSYVAVPDANQYWLTTSGNWGLYFETTAGGILGGSGDSNRLGFIGGGTPRFWVDLNNGNTYMQGSVGIGTTGPNSKLDVKGAVEVGTGSRGAVISSSATDNFQIKTWTNTPNPNFDIGIGDGAGGIGTTWLHGDNTGRIGIGTTGPNSTLTVIGGDNAIRGAYGRMLQSRDEWLRINDDDQGQDYHTSGIYMDGPGVGIQNGLAIGGSNWPSSGLIVNSGGLVVANGVANGRGTYGEGTLNLDLLSSAANGTGVSGINFRSGGNHPSDGAQIYFESDRNRTSGAEMSRLVIRTENDASGSVMDGILIRGGDVVIDTGQTVDGVVPNPAFELKLDGTTKLSMDSSGNTIVAGYLYKNGGGFQIDHPLDPANKVLIHSFVESPDMKNLYDGVVILDENGESIIELPDWFEALNKDFRYQLTTIGKPGIAYVKEEMKDNKFTIAGDPGMKVSWQVTGTRKDAYAEKHRIKVEEEKGSRYDGRLPKKGDYLAPDCFGEDKK